MGWILSITMIIGYAVFHDVLYLIAASIFALSGSVGIIGSSIAKAIESHNKENSDQQ